MDDNSDETNDVWKEIKEESDHIESKEASLTLKLENLWELESKDQWFREDHDQEEEDDSNEKEVTAQEKSVATAIKTTHGRF